MSITKKILNEFSKKSTIKLSDLYSILSQDVELEHIPHLKHRIIYFLSLKIGLSTYSYLYVTLKAPQINDLEVPVQ